MPRIHQAARVSDNLDMIRGVSAIVVLIYHVRYRFFFDFGDVASPTALASIFYAATAFGHDAVMVFFVLSGYFISASVIRDQTSNQWSWTKYTVNRATRLYVVLIPGLFLTIFWDSIGLSVFPDHVVYSGHERPWYHDFVPVEDQLNIGTFVSNLAFLQTILAPPLGSNASLWSLSYEWWYYALFPLIWIGIAAPTAARWKVAHILLAAVLLFALGRSIASYFPIWLLGTAVYLLPEVRTLKRNWRPWATAVAILSFGAIVVFTHTGTFRGLVQHSVVAADYVNGIAFAALLFFLLHDQTPAAPGAFKFIGGKLAAFSYTLYVVHLPLLVFVRAAFVPDEPWTPSVFRVVLAVAISVLAVVYAYSVYLFTEARTDVVRRKLGIWLGIDR